MLQTDNFNKAFVQLNEIIKYLDNEIINKIPLALMKAINNARINEYKFVYNEELPLYEQNMLPETKALLSILYSDYLCTKKEKLEIVEYKKQKWYKKLLSWIF